MTFNYFKIRFIQTLLNININFRLFNIVFLVTLFFLSATIFGFWNLLVGYYHLAVLVSSLVIIFFFLKINIKNFKYVSLKYAVNWLEEQNFKNINPLVAIKDNPAEIDYNKLLWKAHIQQSYLQTKNINFFFPKINLDSEDPLKLRFLFIFFFIISLFWGYSNNVIEKNISKIFQVSFKENKIYKEDFNIVAWVTPPYYTGLSQINLEIEELQNETIYVPYASELAIQTVGLDDKNIKVNIGDSKEYDKDIKSQKIDIKYKISKKQNIKILVSGKLNLNFYLDVIKDFPPQINFISKPEIVNGVSIKFTTSSMDDYRVKRAIVSFAKPKEYQHFKDNNLLYELSVSSENSRDKVKSFFYENLSGHLWAGNNSKIEISVFDDLNQKGMVEFDIALPEKTFYAKSAKLIYNTRASLAKRKISLEEGKQNIHKTIFEKKEYLNNSLVKKKYELVVLDFEKINSLPLSYNHSLYKNLWDLAVSIEEGTVVASKNSLEQIEQNLFDSIKQRESDKISTNVEKYKESLESLLDLNNEEGQNSMNDNENNKNIKNQIEKATNSLQDLLRTGSKENLDQMIQELKQLSESIKNPNRPDKEDLLKEKKKKDFINKLSELLNEQEMIMEESFNEAANRGKFKQSSEGSGGRTSKEKQENLRNTLGNIMRDIGESENEIPQELGRADRAMRQATRELENGRPDQASNAQGRAAEMLQRAMNKMRFNNNLAQNTPESDREDWANRNEHNYINPIDSPEYQGTSSGGNLEIPENIRVQKAQKIAKELYGRYNEKERSSKDKRYIKNLLDWY